MDAAYIGDFFDRIPGIISQARRHLHDTQLEVIERIHRRLGDSLFLVNHLVSRACNSSSAIDADRQDDFYSLMTAVRSFYDAYSSKITVDDSWEDRLSAVCYQPETIRSRGRPRFVITGRQLDALQERQYSWRSMARTLRVSYRTILRRRRELGMAIGERFSRVSETELDEIVSNILLRTPDAGEVMIMEAVRSRGLRIQRQRIRDSIRRVDPVSRTLRRAAAVVRRDYNVPCPNSLW